MFGYAALNHVFEGGELTGLLLDMVRFEPTRQWGVYLACVHHFARLARGRGLTFTLGFCPLKDVDQYSQRRGVTTRRLQAQVTAFAGAVESAKYIQRLRAFKSIIAGEYEPRFVASTRWNALELFFDLVAVSGVPRSYIFGPDLPVVLRDAARKRLPQRRSPPNAGTRHAS